MYTPPQQFGHGDQTRYNVAAEAVIKAGTGRVARVSVLVAGAVGALHDCNVITGQEDLPNNKIQPAIGNQIAVIPATVGVYLIDWPFANGLVYKPGAAQVVSISFLG